jgi:hypothetical protein
MPKNQQYVLKIQQSDEFVKGQVCRRITCTPAPLVDVDRMGFFTNRDARPAGADLA